LGVGVDDSVLYSQRYRHKIKIVDNPDLRVELVEQGMRKNFPSHSLLDYALAVEKAFTPEEADEYIRIGTLNGLFVLGRSIGFIRHHLDQKRRD
jgi:ATP citrate (pro-S)-lyase